VFRDAFPRPELTPVTNRVFMETAPQKAADSASEARNAAAYRVKDSGYWNKEPRPGSGAKR
jgi:hypothetical protein